MVTVHADTWSLHGDVQTVLERAVSEAIPPFRDDKAGDALAVRNAQVSSCTSLQHCLTSIVIDCLPISTGWFSFLPIGWLHPSKSHSNQQSQKERARDCAT